MTKQEEYREKLLKDPNRCPHCGSEDITGYEFEPEGNYFPIECEKCGCEWSEIYQMVDITDIEIPEE